MEEHLPEKKSRPLIDRHFAYIRSLTAGDSFLLSLTLIGVFIACLWLLALALSNTRISIPSTGGALTEGDIGTPRFVNPVLAVTKADKDLTALVYDGLMELGPEGKLVPNIAESVTVSNDGLTYNVILRKDVLFQDGMPLTAKDVVFTVGKIQDATIGSSLRPSFTGITVEQVSDYELNFVLPAPYAPFIENLTFGILPEHIWKDVSDEEFPYSQRNSDPVGSGAYMVKAINRNASGIPESYVLSPHPRYFRGAPKIQTVTLKFFPSEDELTTAFKAGLIDSVAGIDESRLRDMNIDLNKYTIVRIPLPRTFALFYNENKSVVLRDDSVRKALGMVIDRQALIDSVLGGYGLPITTPIPPGFGVTLPDTASTSITEGTGQLDAARDVLRRGGWKMNTDSGIWEKNVDGKVTPLAFSISTVNTTLFESSGQFLINAWGKLGVNVSLKQFEQSDLTQSVIRPRDYESLLFGTQIGRSLDFYPFWHSSQRNDPGLNIALYANLTTDSILGLSRTATSSIDRNAALARFAAELTKDNPALFLYTPQLIYVLPNTVTGDSFTGVSEPYERFASIHNWYINTESVWPFFKKQQ